MPERWLEKSFPTYQEPLSKFPNLQGFSAFGFGRRICPGVHIAENSLYLLASRVAWLFEVRAKPGVVYRDDDYTPTGLAQPKWFNFEMNARDGRATTARKMYEESPWPELER